MSRRNSYESDSERRALVLMTHDYPPLNGGGLALSVRELAGVLSRDHDVAVLTSRLSDHFADDRGVRLNDAETTGVSYRHANAFAMPFAIRQADVLIAHWTFSFRRLATAAVVLGPMLGTPTIFVAHTAPDHCRYNRMRWLPPPVLRALLYALAAATRRCDAVVALGPSHASALQAAGIDVSRVVPLAVSLPPREDGSIPFPERPRPLIGIAGELSRLKGGDRLPRLLEALTPEFSFRVAGAGPLAPRLARCIAGLDRDRRAAVSCVGHVESGRMAAFYEGLDALLVLSRTEAQCRVVLEAMLAGVLVAAPSVGGIRDLVIDGVTGIIVDVDDLATCRHRLATLLADKSAVDDIRSQARQLATNLGDNGRMHWQMLIDAAIGSSRRAPVDRRPARRIRRSRR